jgi:lysophospholipase L1-like esterase
VQTGYLAAGNQTAAASLPGATTIQSRYLLSGVDALSRWGAATVVTFGDSITDGYASTPDADKRWPDDLAVRLQHVDFGESVGVANEGISGNRVRLEGIGPNAQARFDRDVLSQPGVRFMTVLEGINDIGFPVLFPGAGPTPTPNDIIAVDRQLIARAHQHGIKIYGCTLTPYEGAIYYSANGERTRVAVNSWIRSSGAFDAVIDFDKVVRDPAHPTRFLAAYDSGDHLHPSDKGYQAMADSIDLKLFKLPQSWGAETAAAH